jgi:hypothetical protein
MSCPRSFTKWLSQLKRLGGKIFRWALLCMQPTDRCVRVENLVWLYAGEDAKNCLWIDD